MPAVAPEFARPRRSVLKLSLGLTFAVVGTMLTAIFIAGAPAYAGAVYTLTGLCGACNWSDATKWSGGPNAYPGLVTGDTAQIGSPSPLTVDVAVSNGVLLQVSGFAAVSIPAAGSLQLEASSTLGSAGTITVSGGNLTLNSGGGITLNPAAAITVNSGTASNSGTFTNNSTLTINGGTFTNTGTINNNATMTIAGTAAFINSGGSINVNGGAVFNLNGGTLTNPNVTVVSGIPNGTMNWRGGTIDGSGPVQVLAGVNKGVLNITGANSAMTLDNAQIQNAGTITYSSASNPLSLINGGNINNDSTFTLTTDTPINSDGTGDFVNTTGTFTKNGGVGTSSINVRFDNTGGTVTFAGTLLGIAFNGGGGTHGGMFAMPLSNTLSFDGTHTFGSGAAFSGGLTSPVLINGGTFQVNTGLTMPGNLSNAGALQFGGLGTQALSVSGNYSQAASGSLTVRVNGPIAGSNYDQVRVTGSIALNGTLNAALNFAATNGQTFDIMTDATVSGDFATTNFTSCCAVGLQEIPKPPTGTQVRLQAVVQTDMTMLKTGPASVLNGQNATFTVKAGNGGPGTATNVVVTEVFSGGTFVSATPTGGGTCTGVSSPFTCNWPTMVSGGAEFVTVVLRANGAPGPLNNTASVTSNESDPVPGNNSGLVSVTVNPAADLAITGVSGLPNPVNAAASETWQVGVNNAGPDPASNVAVNIAVSAGTIISASGPGFSCSNTASTATCTIASLASGSSPTITVNATAPNQGGPWTMNANVTSTTGDPASGNNSSSGTVTVNSVYDIGVVKTLIGSAVAGQSATYTITVGNSGPSNAGSITVDDTPGPGLTFIDASGSGCGGFPCTISSLAAGANTTITAQYGVASSATGTISNTATVSSAADSNSANDISTTTNGVVTKADLSVTKTGPANAAPGSTINYTIVVLNSGPSDASGVTLNDPAVPGLTFVSASGAGCVAFPCIIGAMPAGSSKTVTATYTVQPTPPPTITNTAKATSSTFDPNTANDSGSATTTTSNPCPTSAPTNLSPANGATNVLLSGTLSWSDAAPAYRVFLDVQGPNACTKFFGSTTATSIQYAGLQPGTTYQWRVEATGQGCTAKSAACVSFTTTATCPTTPPTLISPINTTVNGSATFTWSAVAGAINYKLFVNGTQVGMTTATTFGPIAVSNGPISWFVIAEFAPPCLPLQSATGTFNGCSTATTIPSIIAQADAGQTFTLSWEDIGASSYEADGATDPSFTTNKTTRTTTGTSLDYQHPVMTPTAFYYRVRGFFPCANGFGPDSVTVRIVLAPITALINPNVSAPAGSTTLIPIPVHIPGFPDGTFPFTATLDDKPWLDHLVPTMGMLPPEGIDLTVFANPTGLPPGTRTATVFVHVTTPGFGPITANGVTTVSAPVSISLVTPVTPKPAGPPSSSSVIIPSAGHLDGINSHWQSNAYVANTSLLKTRFQLTYTPDDIAKGVKQTVIDVDTGATTALDDIVKTWYGVGSLGETANGVLEIRPLDSAGKGTPGDNAGPSISFAASSKTYNVTSNGTLGEFVPAIPFANFVGRAIDTTHAATILGLQQISQTAAMRTNVGVMEASGQPASVLISVFDPTGKKLLDFPLDLRGGEQRQLNSFLAQNKITLPDGRIEVKVTGGEGKVTTYASVIDNNTGDPILVSGVALGQNAFDHFVLPGVADLNTGSAAWRTEMDIFNPSSTAQFTTLTFYPQNNSGPPQMTSMTINAGEIKRFDNVLSTLFGLSNTGGAIHVTTATPTPLVLTGRTFNLTPNGTFGQLIEGVTAANAVGKGESSLQILQAEDSVRARTNLGVSEVTGKPATVEVTVFLPDSKIAPSTQIPVPANGFIQVPVIQSLGLSNVYNARVSLRVVDGDGKISAYGSIIDQLTMDATYVPAQK